MNIIYITLILLFTLVVLGCKSTNENSTISQSKEKSNSIQKTSSTKVSSNYPEWVVSPALDGHYVVLGSAPKQINSNYRAQLVVAIASARAELAKIKNTSVTSTLDIKRTSENPLAFKSHTNLESNVVFDVSKAEVIKSWKHPKTEELFILYGYKTN